MVTLQYKKKYPGRDQLENRCSQMTFRIHRLTSVKFTFLLLKLLFSHEDESDWRTVPNEEHCSLFPSAFDKPTKALLERWDFWTPLCSQQKSKAVCESHCLRVFMFYIYVFNFMLKQKSFLLREEQLLLLKKEMPFCIPLLGRFNSITRLL